MKKVFCFVLFLMALLPIMAKPQESVLAVTYQADINGDGLVDIVLKRFGEAPIIYLNDGRNCFYDASEEIGEVVGVNLMIDPKRAEELYSSKKTEDEVTDMEKIYAVEHFLCQALSGSADVFLWKPIVVR